MPTLYAPPGAARRRALRIHAEAVLAATAQLRTALPSLMLCRHPPAALAAPLDEIERLAAVLVAGLREGGPQL